MIGRSDREVNYWVSTCVQFDRPMQADSGEILRGYYVHLGLRCVPSDLRRKLVESISDGNIDWSETTWEPRDPGDISDEIIRSRINAAADVWYRSGRILFP